MRYLAYVTTVAVALLVGFIGLRFGYSHHFAPEESGIHGLVSTPDVEVLFIGSSHTRQSYDAHLLERLTGRRVFLVAYNGLDPVSMVPIVKYLFNRGERPRMLVVEAYGAIVGRPHQVQDSRLFFDADPELKRALLAEFTRPPRTIDKYADAFTLLANRNNEAIVAYPLQRALLANLSYRGAYQDKWVPGLAEGQFRKLSVPLDGDLTMDPEQRAAVREIIRLARRSGVPIVFVEAPLPGPVSRLPVMQRLKAQLQAVLAEENVPYYDGESEFAIDEPALYADSNHLSSKGREVFTRNVAARLMDQLPHPSAESR